MTGFTSSSNSTRSPMIMASATPRLPGENATQEVSPMKGGIFQPSTRTSVSLRGNDAFTTPSGLVSAFSTPVASATAFSETGGESAADAGGGSPAATGAALG